MRKSLFFHSFFFSCVSRVSMSMLLLTDVSHVEHFYLVDEDENEEQKFSVCEFITCNKAEIFIPFMSSYSEKAKLSPQHNLAISTKKMKKMRLVMPY